MNNISQIIAEVINDVYRGPMYNSIDDTDTVYVCGMQGAICNTVGFYINGQDVLATVTIGNMITVSNNMLFQRKKDISFPLISYTDELLIESLDKILGFR